MRGVEVIAQDTSEIGYHGGKVKVARPRVRGKEVSLESWQALRDGNLLLEWALNLMVPEGLTDSPILGAPFIVDG